MKDQPRDEVIEFTSKVQCNTLRRQMNIVMKTIAFTGCCIDNEGTATDNSTLRKCDLAIIDELVSIRTDVQLPPHVLLFKQTRQHPQCGDKKQTCNALHRVYEDLTREMYRVCIAPFPEMRSAGTCGFFEATKLVLKFALVDVTCAAAIAEPTKGLMAFCISSVIPDHPGTTLASCVCEWFQDSGWSVLKDSTTWTWC